MLLALIVKFVFVTKLVDAVIIIMTITNTTVLGFIHEYKSERSIEGKRK